MPRSPYSSRTERAAPPTSLPGNDPTPLAATSSVMRLDLLELGQRLVLHAFQRLAEGALGGLHEACRHGGAALPAALAGAVGGGDDVAAGGTEVLLGERHAVLQGRLVDRLAAGVFAVRLADHESADRLGLVRLAAGHDLRRVVLARPVARADAVGEVARLLDAVLQPVVDLLVTGVVRFGHRSGADDLRVGVGIDSGGHRLSEHQRERRARAAEVTGDHVVAGPGAQDAALPRQDRKS